MAAIDSKTMSLWVCRLWDCSKTDQVTEKLVELHVDCEEETLICSVHFVYILRRDGTENIMQFGISTSGISTVDYTKIKILPYLTMQPMSDISLADHVNRALYLTITRLVHKQHSR